MVDGSVDAARPGSLKGVHPKTVCFTLLDIKKKIIYPTISSIVSDFQRQIEW